ncbi:T9SS type A sorting domain-containing protein [Empedobacter brevis]|uniref:T9SS type A sorting domain-containing protein n=1 Tax=Empedobacter brevis TaxID=247 RepID=UPI0028AC73D8|nr:T9SS type A sorting domain-containing protein [Empedobacter brevis]
MKTLLTFLFCLINFICLEAQNYVIDKTYGDENGIAKTGDRNDDERKYLSTFINDTYYLFRNKSNTIYSIDQDGNTKQSIIDHSLFDATNITFTKIFTINSKLYLLGKKEIEGYPDPSSGSKVVNSDIYLFRLNLDLSIDKTFSNNGGILIDFGGIEYIENIVLDDNGNLFCIGNYKADYKTLNEVIYFKIKDDGKIDYSFDSNPNGFKKISYNSKNSYSLNIIRIKNELFLAGQFITNINGLNQPRLVLTKIDNNGNIDTSFDNNGNRIIEYSDPNGHTSFSSLKVYNDNIYLLTNWSWSFASNGSYLTKYNFENNSFDYKAYSYGEKYFKDYKIHKNKIYIGSSNSRRDYMGQLTISRSNIEDGNLDTTFGEKGILSLAVQGASERIYLDSFYFDSNDRIVANCDVQFAYHQGPNTTYYTGSVNFRLIEGTLFTKEQSNFNDIKLSPNPVKDMLTINSKEKIKKIEIFSLDGKLIKNIYKPGNQLNISDLLKGNYIFKLYIKSDIKTKKIIKI